MCCSREINRCECCRRAYKQCEGGKGHTSAVLPPTTGAVLNTNMERDLGVAGALLMPLSMEPLRDGVAQAVVAMEVKVVTGLDKVVEELALALAFVLVLAVEVAFVMVALGSVVRSIGTCMRLLLLPVLLSDECDGVAGWDACVERAGDSVTGLCDRVLVMTGMLTSP